MKKLITVMGMCVALGGCATSHYTAGRDFPSASVTSITNGKTTTAELKSLFGEPYAKSAVSETDEKWVYTYTNGPTEIDGAALLVEELNKRRSKDISPR